MELIDKFSLKIGVDYGVSTSDTLGSYPLQLAYLSFFFVESGEGKVSIDFQDHTLNRGSFIVVGEDNIVSFKDCSDTFSMQCYLIRRDLASEIAYVLPNELFSYLHYYPVQQFREDDILIYEMWQSLNMHLMKNTFTYTKRILCNQFQNLFLTLSEQVNYNDLVIEKHYSRQEELCWKFWDLISKRAKSDRDVGFYAGELCVTPYYLSQVTQQFLNYSPKELINRQVILEIKYYLVNTEFNISQIAEKLNFADPSYMGRFFKREVGMNPLEFRRDK